MVLKLFIIENIEKVQQQVIGIVVLVNFSVMVVSNDLVEILMLVVHQGICLVSIYLILGPSIQKERLRVKRVLGYQNLNIYKKIKEQGYCEVRTVKEEHLGVVKIEL